MSMILLHGTGTHNKGAELMAAAVLEHFRARPNPPEFAVPAAFGAYRQRARYGLWTLLDERRFGRAKLAALLAHRAFRRKYGLAAESDITAVIDASGFAFGDQHAPRPTQDMARMCKRWKHRGLPIVFLPQAFGPFTSGEIRQAFRELVAHCDLLYCRDQTSLEHVHDVVGKDARIRLAPDFTNQVKGALPAGFSPGENQVFLVPNVRMLDKTNEDTRDEYIPFLGRCIAAIREIGCLPCVVLYTPEDAKLVPAIKAQSGDEVPVIEESCPLYLKGIIGTARAIISSRFHALCNALSQAVPAIATGWSHKYQELLGDYGCPECILDVQATQSEIARLLAKLTCDPDRSAVVTRVRDRNEHLHGLVSKMWQDVDNALRI